MDRLVQYSDVDLLGHGDCGIDFDAGECSSVHTRAGSISSVGAKRPQCTGRRAGRTTPSDQNRLWSARFAKRWGVDPCCTPGAKDTLRGTASRPIARRATSVPLRCWDTLIPRREAAAAARTASNHRRSRATTKFRRWHPRPHRPVSCRALGVQVLHFTDVGAPHA